jgi:hypothetical protein
MKESARYTKLARKLHAAVTTEQLKLACAGFFLTGTSHQNLREGVAATGLIQSRWLAITSTVLSYDAAESILLGGQGQ